MHAVLVTHYFPPIGGPGARRMLGWVNGFVADGHRVTVVTPEAHARDPYYQPAERYTGPAEVLTPRVFDPARLARGGDNSHEAASPSTTERRGVAARIRPWLLLPDQRRLANGPLVAAAKRAIAERRDEPTLVLTSSPYNSVHLAGASLKRSLGERITWIADFRDDWFHPVFFPHPNAAYRAYNRRLERRVLRAADGLTIVSRRTLERIRERQADRFEEAFWQTEGAAKWRWMPNGFDPTGVQDLLEAPADDRPICERDSSEPIRVLFSGTLWQNHKLGPFVAALASVAAAHSVRFRLEVAGRVIEPVPPTPDAGLVEIVTSGWSPYRDSLAATRQADLLLVHTGPESQDVKIKLFECAAVRRPVFVLGPPESATVRLAAQHIAHPLLADQADTEAIEDQLSRFVSGGEFGEHAFAGLPPKYNRIDQARRLLAWAKTIARPQEART